MKTNAAARTIRKIRVFALCLTIAGLAALEVSLVQPLAYRYGALTNPQSSQIPSATISDMMLASR